MGHLPGVGLYRGLQVQPGREDPPGLGQNPALGVDQPGPGLPLPHHGVEVHDHLPGDKDIPFQDGLPLLKHGIPVPGFDVGDDAVGGGHHIGRGHLVPEGRSRLPFPNDDLRPGAEHIQGAEGQLVHGQHHPVFHLPDVHPRAPGPLGDPAEPQLADDLPVGDGLVAGDLHRQDEPGPHQAEGQGEDQPRQEGIPPPEPEKKTGQAPEDLPLHPALGTGCQGVQFLSPSGRDPDLQGEGVHPDHAIQPESRPGADVQKVFRFCPGNFHRQRTRQPSEKLLHGTLPT